jgi:thiosulfate/3-mercaptopyruvate sulfurtransferase
MLIEVDELMKKLDNGNIRIYDATITDDVYRQGHIPGAAFFDHGKFSVPDGKYEYTLLPEAALAAQIGAIGVAQDSEVIFYACGMLPYAARAWWMLHYAGHDNVRILNGGITAWKNAGGAIEQGACQYEPSVYKGQFRAGMFASKEEVLAAMDDRNVATVNVMPLESFTASHIVGSTCLPCLDLMQGMDYFLPVEDLAPRLNEVAQHGRVITYCGGGIAAAVNAMAHVMTGHDNVAVYDGSLYEWLGEGLPVNGTGKWEIWRQS